ncbi:MAG TPA: hypothetical protein VGM80_18470 [Gaiellaceae bacterium]|jgi:hypothetical protein
MATRKQRARRAKTFRHDYALVDTDEEGNEIELRATELRAKKQGDSKPAGKSPGKPASGRMSGARSKRSGSTADRPLREPRPPSWERALKRGLIWGLVAGAVATFILHGPIVIAALYAIMFVPLTYWTDSFAYKRFERKQAEAALQRPGKTR